MPALLMAFMLILPMVAGAEIPDRAEDTCPTVANAQWPEASLRQIDGQETTSLQAMAGQPAVFVFFRGGWCPYCNRHLSALRHITDDLQEMGYQLIAISPDSPASLREAKDSNEVDYTLLSDSSAELIKALNIAFRVDADTREKYRGYGIDLEKASGETHHLLPVPSVYIVDGSGLIRYQYSEADYKIRLDNDALLSAAREAMKTQQ